MEYKFRRKRNILTNIYFWLFMSLLYLIVVLSLIIAGFLNSENSYYKVTNELSHEVEDWIAPKFPALDKIDYNRRLEILANNQDPEIIASSSASSSIKIQTVYASSSLVSTTATSTNFWPVKTVYPLPGAILPFKRIVAYYGNFYSTEMGVLGKYPEDVMLSKLNAEVEKWNITDPNTPSLPALHYIAVTAQERLGKDKKYRIRMPDEEIDKVIKMAEKINGIVFLDIQAGLSSPQIEVPLLLKYLKMPQVHLAIDPEFYMKNGGKPGSIIGTIDADDINYCIDYLANLVKENDLPPKILIIHRFTEEMITNYKKINIVPEVQVVINMDGWGTPARKINTYKTVIYPEPVQFTGFKLFYKNDTLASSSLMTPNDLLKLTPQPIYIQYQ